MDLLEFGIKNQNSPSAVKKGAARKALRFVKWQADRYEKKLEKEGIAVPENQDDAETMLERIYAALEQRSTGIS